MTLHSVVSGKVPAHSATARRFCSATSLVSAAAVPIRPIHPLRIAAPLLTVTLAGGGPRYAGSARLVRGGVQRVPIREVSAGASDSQRRNTAGRLECFGQRVQAYAGERGALPGTQQPLAPERIDQADHEGVTGAHSVDDLHGPGRHPYFTTRAYRLGPLVGHCHHHDGRAQRLPGLRDLLWRPVGVDPAQVLFADLHDVAALDEMLDSCDSQVAVGDQRRAHVGITGDSGRHPVGVDESCDGQTPRVLYRGNRSGVHEKRRGHHRRTGKLPVQIEHIIGRPVRVEGQSRGGSTVGTLTSRNKLRPCGIDVLGDAPAIRVVADVGEKVDVTAQPGQTDRNVERAAADVLAGDLTALLHNVDQRFADPQPATHCTNSSSVARAPLRCNESSAQRYASTNRCWWDRSANTAVISMNAHAFSCCDRAIGTSESASWSSTSYGSPHSSTPSA